VTANFNSDRCSGDKANHPSLKPFAKVMYQLTSVWSVRVTVPSAWRTRRVAASSSLAFMLANSKARGRDGSTGDGEAATWQYSHALGTGGLDQIVHVDAVAESYPDGESAGGQGQLDALAEAALEKLCRQESARHRGACLARVAMNLAVGDQLGEGKLHRRIPLAVDHHDLGRDPVDKVPTMRNSGRSAIGPRSGLPGDAFASLSIGSSLETNVPRVRSALTQPCAANSPYASTTVSAVDVDTQRQFARTARRCQERAGRSGFPRLKRAQSGDTRRHGRRDGSQFQNPKDEAAGPAIFENGMVELVQSSHAPSQESKKIRIREQIGSRLGAGGRRLVEAGLCDVPASIEAQLSQLLRITGAGRRAHFATMTAALIIPVMYSNTGDWSRLSYALGTVMLLFVAYNLNQFARRATTSGSIYAYTCRGLAVALVLPQATVSGWALIWAFSASRWPGSPVSRSWCYVSSFCSNIASHLTGRSSR
jgi:hypothetical protein